MGAKLIYGNKGEIYKKTSLEEGNFISPMIFADVPKDSPGFRGIDVSLIPR